MKTITAIEFARVMLVSEGLVVEYETKWLRKFERVFRDVFGDDEVVLE